MGKTVIGLATVRQDDSRKKLSRRILTARGNKHDDRPDAIAREERSIVWKLVES